MHGIEEASRRSLRPRARRRSHGIFFAHRECKTSEGGNKKNDHTEVSTVTPVWKGVVRHGYENLEGTPTQSWRTPRVPELLGSSCRLHLRSRPARDERLRARWVRDASGRRGAWRLPIDSIVLSWRALWDATLRDATPSSFNILTSCAFIARVNGRGILQPLRWARHVGHSQVAQIPYVSDVREFAEFLRHSGGFSLYCGDAPIEGRMQLADFGFMRDWKGRLLG